jgi:hypothetical protein
MADYTKSQFDVTSTDATISKPRGAYPENAIDAAEWSLYEPLLTPQQLKKRFLFGIPLVSSIIDPFTGAPERLEPEDLKDMILRAVAQIQLEAKFDIFPVKRSEKKPFDRQEMIDLGRMQSNYKPILSIDKLSVAPGNSPDIMTLPNQWLATDGWAKGQIRIIPTIGRVRSGV